MITTEQPISFSGISFGGLATWNESEDTVAFDWPQIEKAAAEGHGIGQAMAKVLLAARDRPGGFV